MFKYVVIFFLLQFSLLRIVKNNTTMQKNLMVLKIGLNLYYNIYNEDNIFYEGENIVMQRIFDPISLNMSW